MVKDDLKNGDIVTLRNGDRLIYCNEYFTDLEDNNRNCLSSLDDLKNDMFYDDDDKEYRENDIVKVERAKSYEIIYKRETKEMTISEISKALGYDVKIIKEDN